MEAELSVAALVRDLGPIDLPEGAGRLVQVLGNAVLDVAADEWAFFPEDRPVAVRRVTVHLDQQPLLPCRLRVCGEDQLPVDSEIPAIPAGGSLTVCAGIDEQLAVVACRPWQVWPGDNDAKHRREGTDHWLINASDAPRTIAVYRTHPVSAADEVAVELDHDTTPGATTVLPGLLRWVTTLQPGQPTRIGLGWTLRASGSFRLQE
jgi:hypothetical protein